MEKERKREGEGEGKVRKVVEGSLRPLRPSRPSKLCPPLERKIERERREGGREKEERGWGGRQ